jgi:CRP/FNR family transcriptional regulator, cyclic AMP receptor protein
VDIFESLQKEEIRELLSDLLQQNAEINLQAGEAFYTPQEPDGKLFILTKGRVRLYKMESSREFTLEMVDAGTVFGEVAFTPHALRESYAEATEASVVFAMDRAEVERLILQKPQVGIRIISLLSERLHYYETRMEDVTTSYTHQHLGTMIGANREAVTRAFGRLQDEGAVQIRRRLIYVDDVEALERAAGRRLEEEGESLS